MNRVNKNIYMHFLLIALICAVVLFASCSKNEKSANTAPSATITLDESDTRSDVVPSTTLTSEDDYDYFYFEDDVHDKDEVVAVLPTTATAPQTTPVITEPVVVEPATTVPSVSEPVKETPSTPVQETPEEVIDPAQIPVTLPLVNDEYPVETGTFVGASDVVVEDSKKSNIKHTFMLSIDPYALSLFYNDFNANSTLQPYGFNAFLEYRMHLAKYFFVGFGTGVEYYTGNYSYTNVPFLFKLGCTAPLTKNLALDAYALIGAELNTYYRDYVAFSTGAGFDLAYSFTDNVALALGFEYRYSSQKDVQGSDIRFNRFILPTIAVSYTI